MLYTMNAIDNLSIKKYTIKIIGDSLAAGAGSSMSYKTDELIFEDEGVRYLQRVAPNSWWGLLEQYLKDRNVHVKVSNKGCGGAYSYQIRKYLDKLISPEDKIIIILMGMNDRKRNNGMNELKTNCQSVINQLVDMGKSVAVLTPTPSVHSNEYYPNRIFHTNDVVKILRDVAKENDVKLIDIHKHVCEYLENNNLLINDIIYGEGCINDGLHPSDFVQKLMFEKVISELIELL